MIISRRVGYTVCTGKMRNVYESEDVGEWKILKWIVGELGFGFGIGFIWLRIGCGGGLL
jgi:hypothetical protein